MKKLFTILLLLVAFISVKAADILVNSSGLSGSYTTISAAVQAASAGDRILISPQNLPYQEDPLVIDKDLTLMPYSTNSFVHFQGDIHLVLDAISSFSLIGFRHDNIPFFAAQSPESSISSSINDTSINSLSIVNIIDCKVKEIRLDQPKTSLYLSYSYVSDVYFSHGDIVGNYFYGNGIGGLFLGNYIYSSVASSLAGTDQPFWNNGSNSQINRLNQLPLVSECDMNNNHMPFGNVNTFSDTCLIVANRFRANHMAITIFTKDFAFDIRNNLMDNADNRIWLYSVSPPSIGVNQIINNDLHGGYSSIRFCLSYCSSNGSYNFSDAVVNVLNNQHGTIQILPPNISPSIGSYSSLPVSPIKSILAYNTSNTTTTENGAYGSGVDAALYEIGPETSPTISEGPLNPSLQYLNLDLTPNSTGIHGGSHAWSNYHGTSDPLAAGYMSFSSKSRITYLNLPTQIFDPANIGVKAKAVHGN